MNSNPAMIIDIKKGEHKACMRQIKRYMALTSVFLLVPVALVVILKSKSAAGSDDFTLAWLVAAEMLFMCSVLSGGIVLGSLTKSQDDGSFDIFRSTTTLFSRLQFVLFLTGISCSAALAVYLTEK